MPTEQHLLLATHIYKVSPEDEVEKILAVEGLKWTDGGMTRSAHDIFRHSSIGGLVHYRKEYSALSGGLVPVSSASLEFIETAIRPQAEDIFARQARLAADIGSNLSTPGPLLVLFMAYFDLDRSPYLTDSRGTIWQGSYEWVRWDKSPAPWLMSWESFFLSTCCPTARPRKSLWPPPCFFSSPLAW